MYKKWFCCDGGFIKARASGTPEWRYRRPTLAVHPLLVSKDSHLNIDHISKVDMLSLYEPMLKQLLLSWSESCKI